MKIHKLKIISWYALLLCYATLNTAPSEYEHTATLTTHLLQILDQKTAQTEGLVDSTLVKTSNGYTVIATLQNNGIIAGTLKNSTQEVILNQSTPVTYLFEIQLESTTILAAPKQQFYDAALRAWMCAQDLTTNNHIGNQRVISCGKKQKFTMVHQLTTQEHIFTIEQDGILVHNANIVTLNNLSLVFGVCSCMHPVVAVIGRTISLTKLAMSIYEIYQDGQIRSQELLSAMQEEEVVLTTRSYYETRRKQLLNLLEQYRALKQSVMAISNISVVTNLLFTAIPVAQINQPLLPSLQSELAYNPTNKQKLLPLREQELTNIETEINSLQITLMLHLQDHGDRLTAAMAELDPAYNAVQQNLKIQIPYHNRSAANNIAAQTYASLLTLLEVIENLEQKIIVLQRLIQYYQHPENALLLKNSTNILVICNDYQTTLNQIQNFLPNLKKYALTSQQYGYQSLTQSGLLSQQTIVSIQRNLQTHRNETERNHNANAKVKQSQVTHATPPNDPDPDDEEEVDEKTYDDTKNNLAINQNDIIHQFKDKPGHMLNTPENKQRILELIRDIKNRKGKGDWQLMWYAKEEVDGQLWASVNMKTHKVKNCGLNKTPRSFSKGTGLNLSKTPKE